MKIKIKLFSLLVLVFIASQRVCFATPNPQNVLIVYDANYTIDADGDGVQDSLELAQYYASVRGVPAAHIFGAPITETSTTFGSYQQFRNQLLVPIHNKLAELGPTSIDVVLLCYGVPYAFVADGFGNNRAADDFLRALDFYYQSTDKYTLLYGAGTPYYGAAPSFNPDKGRFDHALYKTHGGTNMYLVSRLGWDSAVQGMELTDNAQYGERYISNQPGYYGGTAYVNTLDGRYTDSFLSNDISVKSGDCFDYGTSDKCTAYSEHFFNQSGFPLKWQNTATHHTIGDAAARYSDDPNTPALTAPDALFYSGWYAQSPTPFTLKPGAIWCDLNSFSIRNVDAQALREGAACATGSIFEPYIVGTPQPTIFLYYMLKGYSFVEASNLAVAMLGWMTVSVGDPLYAPLKSKPLVKDTVFPVLVAGFPTVTASSVTTSRVVNTMVKNSPEPEVVQVYVDYGLDITYGSTAKPGKGHWRRNATTLTGLANNSTYHYRCRLVDPVGNTTTTGDFVFYTGNAQIPTSVSVKPSNITLGAGSSQQLSAVVLDQTGNPIVPQPALQWTMPPAVGTFNVPKGILTAANAPGGPFTITAAVGAIAGTCTVTVVGQKMTSIVVTPPVVSVTTNNSVALTAQALDQFGQPMNPQPLFGWSANGGGTIDNTGLFTTAISTGGPYNITAVSHELFGTAQVYVITPLVTSIVVTPLNPTIAVGSTLQFNAVALDQIGQPLAPQPVFVATMTGLGKITPAGLYTAPSATATETIMIMPQNLTYLFGSSIVSVSTRPVIFFPMATATVNENIGNLKLTVKRKGSSSEAVSAHFSTQNGSAISGNDYTSTSGTLSWLAGDTADKTITIPIINDNVVEPIKTFSVTLSQNTPGSILGISKSVLITIVDDDVSRYPGQLQFSASSVGVIESAGTVNIPVVRVNGSQGVVSVHYATADDTASAGSDYTAKTGTLTWADGDVSTKTISVPIINDTVSEPDQTLSITLSAPSGGATLGNNANETVTIVDDDGSVPLPRINSAPTANPSSVTAPATTTQLSVSATDPSNLPLTYTWSVVSGPNSVGFNPNGTASSASSVATFVAAGPYGLRVTVSNGIVSTTADVSVVVVSVSNKSPTVATPASASPNPVTGTTTNLKVLGADNDGEESNLIYTWSATAVPSGAMAPTFSVNGTNPAKNTTVTFFKGGPYTFQCTIKDKAGLSITSSVDVTVNATLASIAVSPSLTTVLNGHAQTFVAAAKDQFSNAIAANFSWSVSGGGTIDAGGIFSATTIGGPFIVTAVSGALSATASVTITSPDSVLPPRITQALNATVNPTAVMGTRLSIEATDPNGLDLTYTWSKVSGPGNVVFDVNGTADSNVVATRFDAVGVYTIQVTVSNGSASISETIDITAYTVLVILDRTVDNITATSAIIHWVTNIPGSSEVDYAVTTDNGLDVYNPDRTTTHAITLTGLSPNTLYHVNIYSGDDFSSDRSGDFVFTTLAGVANPSPSGEIGNPSQMINVARGITASFAGLHDVRIISRNGIETRVPDSEVNAYTGTGENLASGAYGFIGRDAGNKEHRGKVVIIR